MELAIVFAVTVLLWWRWPPKFGGGGPMVFGFGTVPVHDPPPPHDPDPKPESP